MKTLIFLPDCLDLNNTGYLCGYTKACSESFNYYITGTHLEANRSPKSIGYCGGIVIKRLESTHWLCVHNETLDITFNDVDEGDFTCIRYDYPAFKRTRNFNAERVFQMEEFEGLQEAVKNDSINVREGVDGFVGACFLLYGLNAILKLIDRGNYIVTCSTTLLHLKSSIERLTWIIEAVTTRNSDMLIVMNRIVAMVFDILAGLLVVYYFVIFEERILFTVRTSAEFVIEFFRSILYALMGSPAGLKLNIALNQTLGIFFTYHVSLWRLFLVTIYSLFPKLFKCFVVSGFFGITFQIAIFSDILSLLTFHIYGIYVYAARLFGLQIYCLISLWKLFIGRKYNPLRDRVDSYQYSHNQLFVGTLVFTVLLFLFPTTLIYYVVFTSLRVCLIFINDILNNMRYVLQYLPVYVAVLWLFNSYQIRGFLQLQLRRETSRTAPTTYATLKKLSFWKSVTSSYPTTDTIKSGPAFNVLLKNIFTVKARRSTKIDNCDSDGRFSSVGVMVASGRV